MALKKLPLDLQSKFQASQIRTFTTAVEELVFNALDANSPSIAVRFNIQENYIQVIDNGHGLAKGDISVLGERYTTSKFEKSTLPENVQLYGCYGQSLANLIEVSQSVKIISKYINHEETWMKLFSNGKEETCSIIKDRPSVGTTVEIKGFLYNLTIQKKAVNVLQELQNIKTFLEQMALIHCKTSFSLRDNTVNEIIFQVHKNRDTVQTLASVLNICTSSLQEFHVEKNEYKVTGFIQSNNEELKGYQWIYVNGRFLNNSSLHKMVNENLTKGAPTRKIIKTTSYNNEDEKSSAKNKLPDYFIFIICPKNDYDRIYNCKQSILEFKNMVHINKLLDKLVKFYMNEDHLVNVMATNKGKNNTLENSKVQKTDTRNRVKQIMQKILGSHKKKIDGSNLHNGVKGKIMKRKVKKGGGAIPKAKLKFEEVSSGKKCDINHHTQINEHDINNQVETVSCLWNKNNEYVTKKNIRNPSPNQKSTHHNNEDLKYVKNKSSQKKSHRVNKELGSSFLVPVSQLLSKKKNTDVHQRRKNNKEKHLNVTKLTPAKAHKHINRQILSKFEKETKVHDRCNRLAKKVDHMLKVNKRRYRIFSTKTLQYSNIVTNNKSISVRKKVNEIIIHEYVRLAQKNKAAKRRGTNWNDIKKSTDLLYPVTKIINNNYDDNEKHEKIVQPQKDLKCQNVIEARYSNLPGLTYESHTYLKDAQQARVEKHKTNQFLSKMSRDNLASPIANRDMVKNQKVESKINVDLSDVSKTSYSIHFTETDYQQCQTQEAVVNGLHVPVLTNKDTFYSSGTDCVAHLDSPGSTKYKKLSSRFCTLEMDSNHLTYKIPDPKFHQCIEKSLNTKNMLNETADPAEILENNIVFISNSQYAVIGTNTIEPIDPIRMCEAVIHESNIGDSFIFVPTTGSDSDIIKGNTDLIESIRMCETGKDNKTDNQKPDDINGNTFIFHSTNKINNVNAEIQSGELDESENGIKAKRKVTMDKEHSIDGGLDFALNAATACSLDDVNNYEHDTFNLINRRRYIPKGMSPIFLYCNSKNMLNCELYADYFETTVYNNFAQNVQTHTEIFEPMMQNVKEVITREIQRVDIKLNKDKAGLTFNAGSLQNAKILGQVDSKFIATILNGHSNGGHLVLFDQHAVDERIRLEQNMSDYITQDQWKSTLVEVISLKLGRDDFLYLHNYRDKFERLGLEWSFASETQVLVNAIPKAILGKHPRQVDVVLKAVNNLIKEEISIIKEQGGCVSLYPKSIMDLVFSEACRYSIMFGTSLTRQECSSLIEELSRCRTPFQCAHGRPALAVLVDVSQESRPYTVNFKKVEQFRKIRVK